METNRDRIPNIKYTEEVTVYAFDIGVRGYRFSIIQPEHTQAAYAQKMSGMEAFNLLNTIKRTNRKGMLEAKNLPLQD